MRHGFPPSPDQGEGMLARMTGKVPPQQLRSAFACQKALDNF